MEADDEDGEVVREKKLKELQEQVSKTTPMSISLILLMSYLSINLSFDPSKTSILQSKESIRDASELELSEPCHSCN